MSQLRRSRPITENTCQKQCWEGRVVGLATSHRSRWSKVQCGGGLFRHCRGMFSPSFRGADSSTPNAVNAVQQRCVRSWTRLLNVQLVTCDGSSSGLHRLARPVVMTQVTSRQGPVSSPTCSAIAMFTQAVGMPRAQHLFANLPACQIDLLCKFTIAAQPVSWHWTAVATSRLHLAGGACRAVRDPEQRLPACGVRCPLTFCRSNLPIFPSSQPNKPLTYNQHW